MESLWVVLEFGLCGRHRFGSRRRTGNKVVGWRQILLLAFVAYNRTVTDTLW